MEFELAGFDVGMWDWSTNRSLEQPCRPPIRGVKQHSPESHSYKDQSTNESDRQANLMF